MRKKQVPFEIYIAHLSEWVIDRMNYHNENDNHEDSLALGEEFFELFVPPDSDYELFYSIRLKEFM